MPKNNNMTNPRVTEGQNVTFVFACLARPVVWIP
jgi:hypothetical protein